jgi:hypothetical protein
LRGDERIAFVMKPGALLGLGAHFHEFVRSLFDAPAALRRHHTPENVRHAAVWSIALFGGRSAGYAVLIIGPGALAFYVSVSPTSAKRKHGRGRLARKHVVERPSESR